MPRLDTATAPRITDVLSFIRMIIVIRLLFAVIDLILLMLFILNLLFCVPTTITILRTTYTRRFPTHYSRIYCSPVTGIERSAVAAVV